MITLQRLYELALPCDGNYVYAVIHSLSQKRWIVVNGCAEDCQVLHYACNNGENSSYPAFVFETNNGWACNTGYLFENRHEANNLASMLNENESPKFSVGQEVWYMLGKTPTCAHVDQIKISKDGIKYTVGSVHVEAEKDLFPTKRECLINFKGKLQREIDAIEV